MHYSTRITTVALAGALALSALAMPAAASPGSTEGNVSVADNLTAKLPVCVPNPTANVLGVQVPVGSAQSATCAATAH
ncbi:hypothetical protein [Nonomuraea sp. NPDC050643]|uniref:hypothetical protein n=1 Tax=Nonomuraea sp. NPDC050643 TaxID=3155660 RepID=UPI0033C75269